MVAPSILDVGELGALFGLFGISGSGKTQLAETLAALRPGLLHIQASRLMREAHGRDDEGLRTATPIEVRSNQAILAAALAVVRMERTHRAVLIDAHSVIDNDVELVLIPPEAIIPLGITRFVFLTASPSLIAERRAGGQRPRPIRSLDVLGWHQEVALAQCELYARASGTPLTTLDADDSELVKSALAILDQDLI